MVKINYERARLIAETLKPYRERILNLYLKDPQYIAIKHLVEARGCNETSLLVLLNSVVSYNLRIKGEKYWSSFANYFSKHRDYVSYAMFRSFLTLSKNTVLLEQKLKRVEKILASPIATKLLKNPLIYCNNISELVDEISKVLKTSKGSKTIVFVAKMYGYLCYVCGQNVNYSNIDIPVDYRNAVLSLTSCIITECEENLHACTNELVRGKHADIVKKAWKIVCNELNIPCLHLDTFTWLLTGKILEERFNLQKILVSINSEYGIGISVDLLKLLLECAPRYVQRQAT